MCLTLERLEAPGSGEAWQGRGILLETGERRNVMRNCRRGIMSVKKKVKDNFKNAIKNK